jgi:hypothetical protein
MRHLLCALIGVALFGTALARDNRVGTRAGGGVARRGARDPEADRRRRTLSLPARRHHLPESRTPPAEQDRGYYREYTVPTPGSSDRGARRIVTGDKPPVVFYYTADHYKSFQRIQR